MRRLLPLLLLPFLPMQATAQPPRLLATIYPIHLIARNVVAGREGLHLELMLPPQSGCPHDHVLTPQEMHTLAAADVLVAHGCGLEDFLGAPARRANKRLQVLELAAHIPASLVAAPGPTPAPVAQRGLFGRRHAHMGATEADPHRFASPRLVAAMARILAAELSRLDPPGAELYTRNADGYAARLEALADAFVAAGPTLPVRRIATQHRIFEHLAQEMGLEIVGTVQAHGGQNPSAAHLLQLVERVRESGAGAVFLEPQYAHAAGAVVAREAGIRIAVLDPVATGPADAPLDYYETVMRANLDTLRRALGPP